MKIVLPAQPFCLRKDQPLSLQAARGRRICCVTGTLWITVPGMLEDVFLQPGASFTIPDAGRVLVEAVSEATVRIESAGKRRSTGSEGPACPVYHLHLSV